MMHRKTRPGRAMLRARNRGWIVKSARRLGIFEQLEPRMLLAATPIDGRPYVELGPSDNVALDQPRVTVQLIESNIPPGADPNDHPQYVVGPFIFSEWLLDTGANTTLTFQSAVDEMSDFPPYYETQGLFAELGVGGFQFFDTSEDYRFDFAGVDGIRQTLLDTRIISDPTRDLSIFGPWGIHGMPGMTERFTTLDFTGWISPTLEDLYMKTRFPESLPTSDHRYTVKLNNDVNFDVEDGVITGQPPVWADVPFLDVQVKNNGLVSGGNFLFDTGAQVSIISKQIGFDLGLDSNGDHVLDYRDAQFARTEVVGGVGGMIEVPVFLIDEVHVQTEQGPDLVWTDLQWLVLDIAEGIDGVFGFDNITSGWIESFFGFGAPGYVFEAQLDFHGWSTSGNGNVHFDLNPSFDAVVDPNGPGIIINEFGGSTLVSEVGHQDSYSIQLSQQPTSNVVIQLNPSSSVTAWRQGFPSQHSLTFTPANWNVPQIVQVAAVDDNVQQGFFRGNIRHAASSTDPAFQNIGLPRVTVNIIDNDYPAVMVLQTNGETVVSEDGLTDTYQIVLTYPPTQNVTISFEHIGNQVVVSNAQNGSNSLVFTPSNWSTPQSVRVEAVDDAVAEGLHRGWITHIVSTSDPVFQDAFAIWEIAQIIDNDDQAPPPKVLDVIVASSQWGPATIDLVDGGGVGAGNGLGFSLVGAHQAVNLPWNGLDRIYIKFSDDVGSSFTSNNLAMVGTNLANYMPLANLYYGAAGDNVGEIRLSQPLSADALILAISDNLQSSAGVPLDGDWKDGTGTGSGDGAPGGQFNFSINVLPGDIDVNGTVAFADLGFVRSAVGQQVTTVPLTKYDFDFNGTISFADIGGFRALVGTTLPPPPSPPSFGSGDEALFAAGNGETGNSNLFGGRLNYVQATQRYEQALSRYAVTSNDVRRIPALQWGDEPPSLRPEKIPIHVSASSAPPPQSNDVAVATHRQFVDSAMEELMIQQKVTFPRIEALDLIESKTLRSLIVHDRLILNAMILRRANVHATEGGAPSDELLRSAELSQDFGLSQP